MRSGHTYRKAGAALTVVALALSGCITDSTFIKPNGAEPDPRQLESDKSDCRDFGPLIAGFFGGALGGAAEGAAMGIPEDNSGALAVVGAAGGAFIGLVMGGAASASGRGYECCMLRKGYHRV